MAAAIKRDEQQLLTANAMDVESARKRGPGPGHDRPVDTHPKASRAWPKDCCKLRRCADPVGEISDLKYRPSGIQVGKMRVPLGVVGIIYEARPNVTADAAGLCLKAGNAAILRGGSEAIHSNQAIAACVKEGLKAAGLPETAIQVIETTDRPAVGELITMKEFVDVIVPRGGKGLIERISDEARIPVIKHLHGVCHVYIDEQADLEKASALPTTPRLSAMALVTPWRHYWCMRPLPGKYCLPSAKSISRRAWNCVAMPLPAP